MTTLPASTQRKILRWIHLIFSIPILGYIYGPIKDVQQYASAARFVFMPVIILSGLWMFSGLLFAALAVIIWLVAYDVGGSGAAILSQIALFIARKIWLVTRARQSRRSGNP